MRENKQQQESILTRKDISNAVRILYSYRGIKLFVNEPHKRKINGEWTVIKDVGYPKNSHDLSGWDTSNGVMNWVEVKTLNDTLKKGQRAFHKVVVRDHCESFIAQELPGRRIEIINQRSGFKETITV